MNAGELIILGRQLTRIGTAAMRDARLPAGAIPSGSSMVGADVLAHPATTIDEIAQRTGLRPDYIRESLSRLRDQGAVETDDDPRDERRTRVRCTDRHPEVLTVTAAADVEAALRDALGPETSPDALTALLASLAKLSSRLSPDTAASGEPAGAEEDETEETLVTRAVATRSASADPQARDGDEDSDEDEADVTRVDSTRADRTRVDLSRTRADEPRADRTRVDLTRPDRTRADLPRPDETRADWKRPELPRSRSSSGNSYGGASIGNTANARRAVRAKREPTVVGRSGRKRQSRLARIARYLTGED